MNESDKTSKLYNAYRTTDIRHMRNPVVDDQRAAPDDYLIKAKTKFEKETRSPDDVKSDVFFGNDTKGNVSYKSYSIFFYFLLQANSSVT